jgi:hypothetical protein
MSADPVLVALPGTMCTPAVFGPLAQQLAGEVTVDPIVEDAGHTPVYERPYAVAAAVRDVLDRT